MSGYGCLRACLTTSRQGAGPWLDTWSPSGSSLNERTGAGALWVAVAFRLVVKQQLTLARCAESHSFAALS